MAKSYKLKDGNYINSDSVSYNKKSLTTTLDDLSTNKANKTDVPSVINNVTSTSTTAALSANQGRLLNNNIVTLIPVTLYNNASGTNGSITLSTSSENYNRLEIYFRDQEGQYSGAVAFSPNGKRFNLNMTVTNSGINGAWAKIKAITISGKSVTVDWYCESSITDSTVQKNNFIYITSILGIKS